jgi:putative hydrolase of the HAD superfamily
MLPKGILFDLDDTLIAFDAVANPTWQRLCDTYARQSALCDPTHLYNTIQEIRTWYWSDPVRHQWARHNLQQLRREIVRQAFETLGIDNLALAHDMADTYAAEREALIHLFPQAEETLQYLHNHHVALALITNGAARQQRQKVQRFGLERFFTTILIEGEVGYGKPGGSGLQAGVGAPGSHPKRRMVCGRSPRVGCGSPATAWHLWYLARCPCPRVTPYVTSHSRQNYHQHR